MMQTSPKMAAKSGDAYWEKFEEFQNGAARHEPSWLQALRKTGIAQFAETGFPTLKDEDWRFTNVAPIAKLPFNPALEPGGRSIDTAALAKLTFGGLSGTRLVFVDGHYAPELSRVAVGDDGVRLVNLASATAEDMAILERTLGRGAQIGGNGFTALNTAFFTDGALIYVPEGKEVSDPVQVIHVSTSAIPGAVAHPRHLVIAEPHSKLTVVESYFSLVQSAYLTNVTTELVIGEGANVEHCKFQDESASAYHISMLHAEIGRASNLITHSLALGAKLARNGIRTVLAGEGIECVLNGLYLTKDDQVADHHMVVEHAKAHCNSHEYFNGILDGRSRGVFHGRILVHQDAQKTDAKQTNKNLLLSDDAGVNTKPQLEIYADDVKCTHGATIGQLNEESIFYLRARGIGRETARRMLMHAFAGEIIERVRHEPIREELDRLVWARLEQNRRISVAS